MRTALLASVTILGVLVGAVAIAGFIRFNFTNGGDVLGDRKLSPEIADLAITIDNQTFTITDGVAEISPPPGSATTNTAANRDVHWRPLRLQLRRTPTRRCDVGAPNH